MFRHVCLWVALIAWTGTAQAQDKQFTLSAPEDLVATGFLKHLMPRFSLKTGVRITLTDGAADLVLSTETGQPVFETDTVQWRIQLGEDPDAVRFADWLTSDVGERTIAAFQPDGAQMFRPAEGKVEVVEAVVIDGDAIDGERLSLSMCGRCHVINDKNRMNGMGSTPSFAVLRTLPGWLERFEVFYVLKPHGAFTQVADVTPPFDPARPSPIVPIELTLDDLDSIMAYVQTIQPADLGAPIQLQ